MCKPLSTGTDASDSTGKSSATTQLQRPQHHEMITSPVDTSRNQCDKSELLKVAEDNLRDGILYGSLSLALLVSAFSLTMPHLQSRRDELQCDSLCLGAMTSARSTLQLIGSALVGRISDSDTSFLARTIGGGSGRRACLYGGAIASVIGLIIGGTTNSIRGMWLSMVPGALLQQNFSVLKALFADYHDYIWMEQERMGVEDVGKGKASAQTGSVGKLGMSVGLAFMAGPLVGALFVQTYDQANWLAVALTMLSAVAVSKLPNVTMDYRKLQSSSAGSKGSILSFLDIKAARTRPAMFLMTIRICMALAFHIFNTIWTASLKDRFNFGAGDHGKFMSFVGLTYALSQGFVANRVTKAMGPSGRVWIVFICCLALGAGRYFAFHTNSLPLVYVIFAFIVMALGVVNTILTVDTSKIASSDEIGGLFGVFEAVQSAAGMIGPILGGSLAFVDPVQAPLFAVVGLYLFVSTFVLFGYESNVQTARHKVPAGKKSYVEYTKARNRSEKQNSVSLTCRNAKKNAETKKKD